MRGSEELGKETVWSYESGCWCVRRHLVVEGAEERKRTVVGRQNLRGGNQVCENVGRGSRKQQVEETVQVLDSMVW